MTVLLAVWGASPGIGKSTLCAALTGWLADAGVTVDHFREEEVLTRPEFAAVAEEFTATGTVAPATLLACTARFVDSVLAHGDEVVVADALMPFIPTLLATGHDDLQIEGFMADLDPVLAPLQPVLVFLDGEPAIALPRAAAREEPGWLDWYVAKLARYGVDPPVHDVASAIDYLSRERATTLHTAKHHAWRLALVEHASGLTRNEVLRATQHLIRPWIPTAENGPNLHDGTRSHDRPRPNDL